MPTAPAERSILAVLAELASPERRHLDRRSGLLGAGELFLRLAGAALLAGVGAIHLHLWLAGYRAVPAIGKLFLADVVCAFLVAGGLVAWPSRLSALAGAGLAAGTLVGLVLSVNVGLFGFRESIHASFVVPSLVVEATAALVLLSWTVLVAASPLTAVAGGSGPRLAALHHGPAPSRSRRAERIGTHREPRQDG